MQTESKTIKETLAPILHVLSDLGGIFSFMDDDGNQFVLASREEFEQRQDEQFEQDQQLELPHFDSVADAIRKNIDESIADDVIDRINRDIAMTHAQVRFQDDAESESDELDDIVEMPFAGPTPPPVPKIRFESYRGDLPPQLQD